MEIGCRSVARSWSAPGLPCFLTAEGTARRDAATAQRAVNENERPRVARSLPSSSQRKERLLARPHARSSAEALAVLRDLRGNNQGLDAGPTSARRRHFPAARTSSIVACTCSISSG